jgi:poly-gamma-glutamate biosynthesis protein PgsC/CapC
MEPNLLSLSIGIGLAVSLLFSELFGLAAGGMVVPGYIGLYLNRPLDVGLTLVAALLTFFLVRVAATFVILYGRRRTVLMILVGYGVGALLNAAAAGFEPGALPLGEELVQTATQAVAVTSEPVFVEFATIGFIVPGLIAIWLDRQGVVETLAAMITASVVVRLVLVLAVGTELLG